MSGLSSKLRIIPGNFELQMFFKLDELFSLWSLSAFLKSSNFNGKILSSIFDKIKSIFFISSHVLKNPHNKVLTNFSSSKKDSLFILLKTFIKSFERFTIAHFWTGIFL